MLIKCKISSIGEPRQWTTKDDTKMFSYPCAVNVPYIDNQGQERSDSILGEIDCANEKFIESVKKNMSEGKNFLIKATFAIREYNGKMYQNCRFGDISILF